MWGVESQILFSAIYEKLIIIAFTVAKGREFAFVLFLKPLDEE
jgi:hypothetical protein